MKTAVVTTQGIGLEIARIFGITARRRSLPHVQHLALHAIDPPRRTRRSPVGTT